MIDGITYYTPNATLNPGRDGLQLLSNVEIAPENCDGWPPDAGYWDDYLPYWSLWEHDVGYLSHQHQRQVLRADFVVSIEEAWCSGVREPSILLYAYNLWTIAASVDQSKSAHDPLEWWNTNDAASPQRVNYPGWCQYLYIHVAVKADIEWNATMDQGEYDFVKTQLELCGPIIN